MSGRSFPTLLSRRVPDARSILLISDIEMSVGGVEDDFSHDGLIADLLDVYTKPPYDSLPVDLVLNGDVYDTLKIPYKGVFTWHITPEIALYKLNKVIEAHSELFDALQAFGSHSSGNKRLHFVVGNHDPDIMFPEVQARLRQRLAGVAEMTFAGFSMRVGPVHIEHGHQLDQVFAMDSECPFGVWNGESILKLPWLSAALIEALSPIKSIFHTYERLRPRSVVFERWPELAEIVQALLRKRVQASLRRPLTVRRDPAETLTWAMAKQIVLRAYTQSPNAGIDAAKVAKLFIDDPSLKLAAFGHTHKPTWSMVGTRTIIHTGCMRDEYEIDREGESIRAIPKSYGEVVLVGDKIGDVLIPSKDHDDVPRREQDIVADNK